ncbi:glycosyltransferase family 2 protein [Nanoarchaeota archaeon]
MEDHKEVSVILPCLNEEQTIGVCIKKAKQVFQEKNIDGEIIVVDNGCTDNSAKIAKELGAEVFHEPIKGYGAAYLKGISVAKGQNLVMADADNTYDLLEMPKLLAELKDNDFVIGSRLNGQIKEGAMPLLHRYIGNPTLTFILNRLFKLKVSDAHSGFRAFTKKAISKMDLNSTGMEFASEMIMKAKKNSLRIKEVPITYHPRKGESKLHSFRDGWRHLRFMFLYSPNYLFIAPGMILFLLGIILMGLLLKGPITIGSTSLDIHPMILGSLLTIVGFQIINLGIHAKSYAIKMNLEKPKGFMKLIEKYANFERGAITGLGILLIGAIAFLGILIKWINSGFGELTEVRTAIFSMTLIIMGLQVMFSAFFLSVLGIKKK